MSREYLVAFLPLLLECDSYYMNMNLMCVGLA